MACDRRFVPDARYDATGGSSAGAPSRVPRRHPVGTANRSPVERFTNNFSIAGHVLAAAEGMDRGWHLPTSLGQNSPHSRSIRQNRLGTGAGGRNVRPRKKRVKCVGKTKCGKGSKIMTLVDGRGIPLAIDLHSASPAEVTLIEPLLS